MAFNLDLISHECSFIGLMSIFLLLPWACKLFCIMGNTDVAKEPKLFLRCFLLQFLDLGLRVVMVQHLMLCNQPLPTPYLLYPPEQFLLLTLPFSSVPIKPVQELHLFPVPVLLTVLDLPAKVHHHTVSLSQKLLVLLSFPFKSSFCIRSEAYVSWGVLALPFQLPLK